MTSSTYNNNVLIVQTRDYVMLQTEMIHEGLRLIQRGALWFLHHRDHLRDLAALYLAVGVAILPALWRERGRILEVGAYCGLFLREAEQPLAIMDRLRATLQTDERIIALREQVVRQTRAQLDDVVRYILTQPEHHRRRTFQEEFRMFLKKYGVEHDEAYVWD